MGRRSLSDYCESTDRTFIFLHNFRAGGNALYDTFLIHSPCFIFKLGTAGQIYNGMAEFIAAAKEKQAKFFFGHFAYGVHTFIETPSSYITNIRNPTNRLISGLGWKKPEESLEGWLARSTETDNGMTRRLAGIGEKHQGANDFEHYNFIENEKVEFSFKVDESVFEAARNNLINNIYHVYLSEFMEECHVLLEDRLGVFPIISLRSWGRNSASHNAKAEELRPEVIETIKESNIYDQRLYDIAKSIIEKELEIQTDDFWERVRIRRILKNTLGRAAAPRDAKDVLHSVAEGMQRLHFMGMYREILGIVDLCARDPEFSESFRDILEKIAMKLCPRDVIIDFKERQVSTPVFLFGNP